MYDKVFMSAMSCRIYITNERATSSQEIGD